MVRLRNVAAYQTDFRFARRLGGLTDGGDLNVRLVCRVDGAAVKAISGLVQSESFQSFPF